MSRREDDPDKVISLGPSEPEARVEVRAIRPRSYLPLTSVRRAEGARERRESCGLCEYFYLCHWALRGLCLLRKAVSARAWQRASDPGHRDSLRRGHLYNDAHRLRPHHRHWKHTQRQR